MQVILHIQSGALAGKAVEVYSGQTLQIGRTEWADLAIIDDTQMADVHFAIACGTSVCRIHNLSGAVGLLVNEEKVEEIDLSHADQIVAGTTTFLLQIIDHNTGMGQADAIGHADHEGLTPEKRGSGLARVSKSSAAAICAACDLDEAAVSLLLNEMNPREFIQLLIENELLVDATMFLARAMPKQEAIWWACISLEIVPPETTANPTTVATDQRALEAARQWVYEPGEAHRRLAEQAAEATNLATPAGLVAQGVFWSGGSISLPDLPEVLPPDHLTAQAVAASLRMALAGRELQEQTVLHQEFLSLGIAVASGERTWE